MPAAQAQPKPRVRYLGAPHFELLMMQNGGRTQRNNRKKWSYLLRRPVAASDFQAGSNPPKLSAAFRHSSVVWHGSITAHGLTPAYRRRHFRAAVASIEGTFGPNSVAFTQGPITTSDGQRMVAAITVTRQPGRQLRVRFQRAYNHAY